MSEALKYALLATDVLRHVLTSVVPVVNKYTTGTSWYRKGLKAADMHGTLAMQCPWMKVYAENCTHARVVRIMWIVCTLHIRQRERRYIADNRGPIVVRDRESLLHGEGGQSTIQRRKVVREEIL